MLCKTVFRRLFASCGQTCYILNRKRQQDLLKTSNLLETCLKTVDQAVEIRVSLAKLFHFADGMNDG